MSWQKKEGGVGNETKNMKVGECNKNRFKICGGYSTAFYVKNKKMERGKV